MKVVGRRILVEFGPLHPRARGPLAAWYEMVRAADWRTPEDVRDDFNTVRFIGDDRVVFGVGGDAYRIVVLISYPLQQVMVRFVGARADFDEINPETV